ncbi:MAG: hypothetical protein ACI9UK_000106 [Candidatus Krumholzibacteriia bacterium]
MQEIVSQPKGPPVIRLFASASRRAALATVILVSCLLTTPLLATTARLRALGAGDFLEDDHNVQRWYGSLADYPDLIVLDSGDFTIANGWQNPTGNQYSGPSLGAHFQLKKMGTVALFVDGNQNDINPGSMVRDSMGASVSAMWSKRYGALQPALVLRYGHDSGSEDESRSRVDYGFGLRVDLNEGAYLDFAGELKAYHEDDGISSRTSHDNYGFRARSFIKLGENAALVPLAEYLHEDRPQPAFAAAAPANMNGHVAKVGLGLHWYKDSDHTLLFALDHTDGEERYGEPALTDLSAFPSTSQDWQSTAISLGIETRYAYWFTLRASAIFRQLETKPLLGGNERSDGFNLNLGAAIQLADYDLDLSISDTQPRSFAQTPAAPISAAEDSWFSLSLRRRW